MFNHQYLSMQFQAWVQMHNTFTCLNGQLYLAKSERPLNGVICTSVIVNEFFILVIHTQQTKHFVKASSFKYTVSTQKCKANGINNFSMLPGCIFIHMCFIRICCCCCSFLCSAILCSWADSLHSHVILHEWIAFYSAFLTIHSSGVLTVLAWLVPHETAAIMAHSVYHVTSCKAMYVRCIRI